MTAYNGGLDILADIATADLRFLLLKGSGYTFDKDHDFVADLTPASNEVTAVPYARVALSGGTRTVVDATNRINYISANPNFGALAAGESVTAAVLFRFVTNDADSVLVEYYAFTPVDSGNLNPFVVNYSGGILAYVDEA